jgi:WD40 repeat protein
LPAVLGGPPGDVALIAIAPDGRQLAVVTSSGALEEINGPDGRRLLVPARRALRLRTWDLGRPEPTWRESEVEGGGGPLALSRDGRWLAAAGWDLKVRLWDRGRPTAPPQLLPLTPHNMMPLLDSPVPSGILSLAFSPDGRRIVVGGYGGALDLWDLSETSPVVNLPGHKGGVNSLTFDPENSRRLASAGDDGSIRLWDLGEPKPVTTLLHPKLVKAVVQKVVTSAQGPLLAAALLYEPIWPERVMLVAFDGKRPVLWAVNADGVVEWDLKQPERAPTAVSSHSFTFLDSALSPGTRRCVGALHAGLWLLDLSQPGANFIQLGTMPQQTAIVGNVAVAISLDGQQVAAGCNAGDRRGTVRLWRSLGQKWEPRDLVKPGAHGVRALAFSRDGHKVVAADYGTEASAGELRVWDLERPEAAPVELRRQDRGHPASVTFGPKGDTVASGDSEGRVLVWDLSRPHAEPLVLSGHQKYVRSVAYSPDGWWLASGGADGQVKVWAARTEQLAEMVCDRVWRNLTMEEWRDFVGEDVPYERTCPKLPPGKGAPPDAPAGTAE